MTQASLTREQLEVLLEIHDPDTWEGNTTAWDNAAWDGVTGPSYLNLVGETPGPVSSPDTPDLQIIHDIRWTAKFRDDSAAAAVSRRLQWQALSPNEYSHNMGATYSTSFYAGLGWPTGAGTPQISQVPGTRTEMGLTPPGRDVYIGAEFVGVNPTSQALTLSGRAIKSADGVTWGTWGTPLPVVRADAYSRNSSAPMRLGELWQGRIYWMQAESINRARLVFPGVPRNWAWTPHAATGQVPTGDIEIVARVSRPDWANAGAVAGVVLAKNGAWYFLVSTVIHLWSGTAAGTTFPGSSAHGFANGATGWIKATRVSATGVTSFYTAPDSELEPTVWTARGTSTAYAGSPPLQSNSVVSMGAYNAIGNVLNGRVLRVILRDGIGGPTLIDVDENDAGAPTATASTFVSRSGHTFTVYELPALNFVFPGVLDTYLSVSDPAALDVTNDLEIVVRADPGDWSPTGGMDLVAKYNPTGNQRTFRFVLNASGSLGLWISVDGSGVSTGASSSVTLAAVTGPLWLKVTRQGTVVKFYTAPSAEVEPTTWTQLGNDRATAFAGTLFNSTAPVTIGGIPVGGGGIAPNAGRIYHAIVRNGIAGTVAVNVSVVNPTTVGATSFTATTGGTVTVLEVPPHKIVQGDPTIPIDIVQPQPNQVIWRFDAEEVPRNVTSYVDPRGRTWNLTSSAVVLQGQDTDSVWSDYRAGYVDVTCDTRGFVIERGRQTNWDNLLAANIELELDNASGVYSVYGSNSWPRIRPGFVLEVWAKWDDYRYPLFVGTVSEYTEGQTPGDYKIGIKAQDAFYKLATPIDGEYSPGVPYHRVDNRIHDLLNRANFQGPRYIQWGQATMLNYETTRNILDEIQLTALSDGGVFFIDNDGTAMYLGQSRIHGRQRPYYVALPSFTDSCDGSGLPYAAIEPIMADSEFGNVIIASNVSQGEDSPQSAKAVDEDSIIENGTYPWSPQQLIICNANYVQAFADFQLLRRSKAFYRINSFECYPVHDDGLWPALLPLRVGDSLFITRTPPGSDTIRAPMLCDGIRIEATPELWKFVVRCSPGDAVDVANFWDYDFWDTATWV